MAELLEPLPEGPDGSSAAEGETPQNINTPEYWDGEYTKEAFTGKRRLDEARLSKIRHLIEKAKEVPDGTEKPITNDQLAFLDIGGGPGELSRFLALENPGMTVRAIDFSPEAIALAREIQARLLYAVDDAHYLNSVPAGSQDLVFCGETLEHLDCDLTCLTNVSRVLKVGGWALFTMPYKDRNKSPEHIREYDLNNVRDLFSQVPELTVVEMDLVGDYNNWFSIVVLAQKKKG